MLTRSKQFIVEGLKCFGKASVVGIIIYGSFLVGQYYAIERIQPLDNAAGECIVPEKPQEKTEETIYRMAKENDLDFLMVFRIIECESRWDKYFKKEMADGSYDRGILSFNSKHYSQVDDDCAFTPSCAMQKFADEVKKGNIKNWLCAGVLGYVK